MFVSLMVLVATATQLIIAAPAKSAFTFYDLKTPLSGPCDSCTGPDGALWVQNIAVDTIARIDPATGQVDEYPIPYTQPALNPSSIPTFQGRTALACAIRPGADGNIYAASGVRNQFLRINTTTRHIDVFTPTPYNPLGDLQPFNDLTMGPKGMFFSQTSGNLITQFDYKTEKFTNYPIPTPNSFPLGMIFFKGSLWFAETVGQKIGRLCPSTGKIKEYPITDERLLGPGVVRAAFTNPDRVCFTAIIGGGNGCLRIGDGQFEVFPDPGIAGVVSFPGENTRDLKRNDTIYYSTALQNYISILNIKTGVVQKIVEPTTLLTTPVSFPFYFNIGMNYGPGDAVWFTQATANRIGRYALS